MGFGVKVHFLQLIPSNSADVPNGVFFFDLANSNAPTVKDSGGGSSQIGEVSGGGNLNLKQCQVSGTIAAKRPFSILANGRIVDADSDSVNGQKVAGITLEAGTDGQLISVYCLGINVSGALTGSGFAPGDEVFVGENGGYTNNPGAFSGGNDTIARLGIAHCSAGAASATVNDLILFPEIISRPE